MKQCIRCGNDKQELVICEPCKKLMPSRDKLILSINTCLTDLVHLQFEQSDGSMNPSIEFALLGRTSELFRDYVAHGENNGALEFDEIIKEKYGFKRV